MNKINLEWDDFEENGFVLSVVDEQNDCVINMFYGDEAKYLLKKVIGDNYE